MTTLQQHPLSAAFPSMSADDFQALKDDVEQHGQREPIVVFEGMVLDGWHRYRACVDLGIKPHTMSFPAEDDPVALVKGANLHRRHLTASQRAAAVVACSAWVPAGRPKKGAPGAPFSTKAELAKEAHVSERTIAQAKVAHKAGLTDAVKSGALTVKEAAQVASGKPAKVLPPGPAPAPRGQTLPPDDGPSAEEIAASARAADDELKELRAIALADDKVAASLATVKRLTALNAALTERNNGLMNEKNELVKRIKALQRKLDKLEQPA